MTCPNCRHELARIEYRVKGRLVEIVWVCLGCGYEKRKQKEKLLEEG